MPDQKLEAVVFRHDLSRHTFPMTVNGTYAYNDKEQIGMFINPAHHVGEIKVPFKKTFFLAGLAILFVIPIYIYLISVVLPTVGVYRVILGLTIAAIPIGALVLARIAAPSIKRRIYCLWGEPEPINLFDIYGWSYNMHWQLVGNLHAVSKNNARFSTMKLTDRSFLLNSVAWVTLSFAILIALVIVIGLVRA